MSQPSRRPMFSTSSSPVSGCSKCSVLPSSGPLMKVTEISRFMYKSVFVLYTFLCVLELAQRRLMIGVNFQRPLKGFDSAFAVIQHQPRITIIMPEPHVIGVVFHRLLVKSQRFVVAVERRVCQPLTIPCPCIGRIDL